MAKNLHNHCDTMLPLSERTAVWFLRNLAHLSLPAAPGLTNSYYKQTLTNNNIKKWSYCFSVPTIIIQIKKKEKDAQFDLIRWFIWFGWRDHMFQLYINLKYLTSLQPELYNEWHMICLSPIHCILLQFNSKNVPQMDWEQIKVVDFLSSCVLCLPQRHEAERREQEVTQRAW